MSNEIWYKNGIKFKCQNCGTCCKNLSKLDSCVYLNGDDIKNIASFLNISKAEFIKNYTVKRYEYIVIKSPDKDCIFLKDNKCIIYKVRPIQCQAWPFWEINLIKKNWDENVIPICKGIGKGKTSTYKQITTLSENKSPL